MVHSPWGSIESDMTEQLTLSLFHMELKPKNISPNFPLRISLLKLPASVVEGPLQGTVGTIEA